MSSAFFGLEIGRRALFANQAAMEVVGHNVSNVNTEGYSRQNVRMESTAPYPVPTRYFQSIGQIGTGVHVNTIMRVRDEFVDRRILATNAQAGAEQNIADTLQRVEQSFGEPGVTGIGQLVTEFFNAFSDLSANPESGAIRSTVRNRAEALINSFRSVDSALSQINPELSLKVTTKVNEVGALAKQIADLNKEIRLIVGAGNHPNDLMDKRGVLLERLSRLVDIQVIPMKSAESGGETGEVVVSVGGHTLVQNETVNKLPETQVIENGVIGLKSADGKIVPLKGGEVYGLIRASEMVKEYSSDLDKLARTLAQTVNAQHRSGLGLDGRGARNFFAEDATNPNLITAASLTLSAEVRDDLNTIAAAAAPAPPNPFASGNGDNARSLAALSYQKLPTMNNLSLSEYYADRVALIGAESRAYQTRADNQDQVMSQLRGLQSSVSGVSLDEEMTKMMQYQRAYQAAARVVNVMDETLDRIINGIGAGR